MRTYRLYGSVLASNCPLPELTPVDGQDPEWEFRLSPARPPGSVSDCWLHHYRLPDGDIWLSSARRQSGYLLRFPDLADFFVSAAGARINCYPVPAAPVETTRHLLLDHVLPLLLELRGRLALHASAVAGPGGAIAFVGATGQGKSTLSASLAQEGYALLTDDCLALEEQEGRFLATASYPGLRLWPDAVASVFAEGTASSPVAHYTAKQRLGPDHGRLRFRAAPVPLGWLYVLAPMEVAHPAAPTTMTPLAPPEAFSELVKHTYRLEVADRERLKREFDRLSRLAVEPRVFRLAYPRDLSRLSSVREAIVEHAAAHALVDPRASGGAVEVG